MQRGPSHGSVTTRKKSLWLLSRVVQGFPVWISDRLIALQMNFAKFSDGHAYRKFFSWNIPTPPRLDECFLPIPGGREPTYLRYAVVDTSLCTGLSFSFWCDILGTMHPHINGGRSSKDAHIETRNAVFPVFIMMWSV